MLRDDVHDVLGQYDDTPRGRLDVLDGLKRCGRQARVDGLATYTLVDTIRTVRYDDWRMVSGGEPSALIFIGTALVAYFGDG
jgi:hypothetical protein